MPSTTAQHLGRSSHKGRISKPCLLGKFTAVAHLSGPHPPRKPPLPVVATQQRRKYASVSTRSHRIASVVGAPAKEAIGRGRPRAKGAMVAAPRFGAQDQRRGLAHELVADRRRRRIDVALVAVFAARTALRRMALSKRAWLERTMIFGRVCAAQRRGSRHFHGFGVAALGVEACMWDPDRRGLISRIRISLRAVIEVSRRFVLLCFVRSRIERLWRRASDSFGTK